MENNKKVADVANKIFKEEPKKEFSNAEYAVFQMADENIKTLKQTITKTIDSEFNRWYVKRDHDENAVYTNPQQRIIDIFDGWISSFQVKYVQYLESENLTLKKEDHDLLLKAKKEQEAKGPAKIVKIKQANELKLG